ncbi:uncharacterized protein LOC123679302 isoform X6 [Harmonia axyridis]|uniref:uncharacterized protein LOC123679302 isoform X6 n=1 Tax=Harmonia axyridis TaxID=115357 RepID=UPI001E276C5A|nr:uncharacterized protein LOC123679302 isoform X6 [Harmonia axyridis]
MLTANVLCLKKKKKKKPGYILNCPDTIHINDGKTKGQKPGNMLHITEDTPADMLSGAMDLTIHLPSGKAVKMCVERRTPMMDLLVQVTTNHQLQITNYTLQPLQTSSSDNYSEKVLSYYPNTPIGALDTQYMKVIPKARILPNTKNLPPGTKPFETTFRLKVHLPRNQLYVTRVSKHIHIGDIMRKVCEEKNLDPNKYEVRHPGNLEEILDPKLTLNDYMITEINLVVKGSKTNTHTFTSEDIMSLRKNEERKPIPSKPGGVFSLLFRRGKSNNVPPSSKEYTPPPSKEDQDSKLAPSTVPIVPKVPQRKRRPAPKPPQTVDKIPPPSEKLPQEEPVQLRSGSVISDNSNCSENDVKIEPGLTIYHSRHSSDSSGYHETSILSDQCNTSLPRRNRLDAGCETMGRKLNRYSESTGNLTKMTSHSRSTSSLIFPGRKKKAAPAPPKPLLKFASSTTNLETLSPVVASQSPLSTSSSKTDVNSTSKPAHEISVQRNDVIIRENAYPTNIMNEISLDDVERYKNYGNSPDSGNSSEISEKSKTDDEPNIPEILEVLTTNNEVMEEWQLPSPPKAFKDNLPNNQITDTENETDSVITAELIEKLERIEKEQATRTKNEKQNSSSTTTNEDNGLILSKLSLENLEIRKSLVYNRELSTSLKQSYKTEAAKEDDFLLESLHPRQAKKTVDLNRRTEISGKTTNTEAVSSQVKQSTLPNFKITTYKDESKQIKVFEDDTIRSNSDFSGKSLSLNRGLTLQENGLGRSMENISIRKHDADDVLKRPEEAEKRMFRPKSDHYRRSVNRSGSFSVEQNEWSSTKPVARSKSQVALRRIDRKILSFESSNMSRSNSLFDVSGLQSLEVMKKIQNKLNTPTTSMETLSKAEVENKSEPKAVKVEENPKKKYQYSPPSVNMGTWSDRPKVPVSVKEDADYKLGQGTNTRHFKSTVKNGESYTKDDPEQKYYDDFSRTNRPQRVTVICNGSSYLHNDFNGLTRQEDQKKKYSEHNIDTMGRSPYGRKTSSQRPHSVAFASDFDISRVPVVRSVELKKKFRDVSSSTLVHLNQSSEDFRSNGLSEKPKFNTVMNVKETKPVMRAKSFLQHAPVVRGFRTLENISSDTNTKIEKYNRFSWQSNTSMTLPSTLKKDNMTTNHNLHSSKYNLRRNESKNSKDDEWSVPNENLASHNVLPIFSKPVEAPQLSINISTEKSTIPKPPPLKPNTVQKKISNRQFVPVLDPRDELLKSIRDFGGKKGLRSRKTDF